MTAPSTDALLCPIGAEILRRRKLGESVRSIAGATGCGVDAVSQCIARLRARGLLPITTGCKGGAWAAFPERRARLVVLWAEGHSAREIAEQLGVSKNAVISAEHRLDLPARPSPIIRNGSGVSYRRGRPDGASTPPKPRGLPRPAPLQSMARDIAEPHTTVGEVVTNDERPYALPAVAVVAKPPVAATPRAAHWQGQASFDEHRCRWRLNDQRPYLWCDEPCTTRLGIGGEPVWSSYCDLHHRVTHVPTPRYREATS